MKSKYLFTSVVALALLSGCIKEEGDDMMIIRSVVDDKSAEKITIVTAEDGYMEGLATQDSDIVNSYEPPENVSNEIRVNCYVTMHSEFSEFTNRNKIKHVGYVYSHDPNPAIGKEGCKFSMFTGSTPKYPKGYVSSGSSVSEHDAVFDLTLEWLDLNSTYFVRSFATYEAEDEAKNKDSVVYNNRVVEVKTVLPEDVWVKRNDAPTEMTTRSNAFVCTVGEDVYMYGGRNGGFSCCNDLWKYDPVKDVWEQKGTFEPVNGHYYNEAKRSNGAMFAYPNNGDQLLYIVGGELEDGTYTGKVFYYSVKNNRFANPLDHPNHGKKYPVFNTDGSPVYEKDANGVEKEPKVQEMSDMSRDYVEDLPIFKMVGSQKQHFGLAGAVAFSLTDNGFTKYFIAFGKNNVTGDGQKHIQTSVYEYDVTYDRTCNGVNELSEWAWTETGITVNGNTDSKYVEGLYQPVCVQNGNSVILGTGESSKGGVSRNFYNVSYSIQSQKVNMTLIPVNDVFKGDGAEDEGFKPRANASAFYLHYTKGSTQYDRFYIGCGRTCVEDEYNYGSDQLINDLWCYDLNSRQWSRKSDCYSRIPRQGAVGFATKRDDEHFKGDSFVKDLGEEVRGMISFGSGYILEEGYKATLNDNWEYIP